MFPSHLQITLTWDMKDYDKLFELMVSVSKKRGQTKRAQTQIVQLGMSYIDQIASLPTRIRLIETIKEICDKKIFLEVSWRDEYLAPSPSHYLSLSGGIR